VAELGQTDDPVALVPGSPPAILTTIASMRAYGDALHLAGTGLARIDTADGWSGPAADAFRAAFTGQPARWTQAGDAFHTAADALVDYHRVLAWAQQQAAAAIAQYGRAIAATAAARSEAGPGQPVADPGEADRHAARATLADARARVAGAGNEVAGPIAAARDKAPRKPGFWDKVGDFFEDAGADLENAGARVVNGLASIGNAVIHHPGDLATMAAGVGLTMLAGSADAGGVALDGTGVGAIAGVPINVVATAGVIAGGGLALTAGGDLMMHAASDDSVSPLSTNHTGADPGYEPTEGFRGSEFSKDEFVEFVNGHTGDANPVMDRPSMAAVQAALDRGTPVGLEGQNAEMFEYNGVRVILNYDMPWKSTAYTIGG
jgi:uncharacterized protein YukE